MNLLTAFHNFLVYIRLHKGRTRKTQEQYAFHLWRLLTFLSPALQEYQQAHGIRSDDFLPPQEPHAAKTWKSPVFHIQEELTLSSVESIKKTDIDTWRIALSDSGLTNKTVNAHMITVRSWLKYLKKDGINSIDPTSIDLVKAIDREVTFLTPEEISRFFDAIPQTHIRGKRDRAIAECIYSTGLRISELTGLNRNDVNLETREFAVRGK